LLPSVARQSALIGKTLALKRQHLHGILGIERAYPNWLAQVGLPNERLRASEAIKSAGRRVGLDAPADDLYLGSRSPRRF
jgi:hypothetical protein